MDEKTRFKIFYYLFWPFAFITASGLIFLNFYNDTLPKVSFGLAITGLGMSFFWMCFTICYNTKNEMESKLFKLEIQTQLDRIENQIKNKE
jgi:hypothetical protein